MRLLDRYLLRELLVPLGYCLGGFLIFQTACRSGVLLRLYFKIVRCHVIWNGVKPKDILHLHLREICRLDVALHGRVLLRKRCVL